VTAYINSLAASAAYAIAAGAKEIVIPPSGTVGSIGVVWMHLDRSQQVKDRGVKPTLLTAGAFKADGSPYGPLEPEARARIQASIDDTYSLFVESVGKHRPKLSADGARQTEAGVYIGKKAVEAGLADRVSTLASLLAARRNASAAIYLSTQSAGDHADAIEGSIRGPRFHRSSGQSGGRNGGTGGHRGRNPKWRRRASRQSSIRRRRRTSRSSPSIDDSGSALPNVDFKEVQET
jgi:ClpP class serine protease